MSRVKPISHLFYISWFFKTHIRQMSRQVTQQSMRGTAVLVTEQCCHPENTVIDQDALNKPTSWKHGTYYAYFKVENALCVNHTDSMTSAGQELSVSYPT